MSGLTFEVSYQNEEKGAVKVLYVDDSERLPPSWTRRLKSSLQPRRPGLRAHRQPGQLPVQLPIPVLGQSPSPTSSRSAQPITHSPLPLQSLPSLVPPR